MFRPQDSQYSLAKAHFGRLKFPLQIYFMRKQFDIEMNELLVKKISIS